MSDLFAPASGEKIGICKVDSIKDLGNAVKKAGMVQKEWAALSYSIRKTRLLKLRDYMVHKTDEITAVIADSTGKTPNDAYISEVLPGILSAGYYVKAVKRMLKPLKIRSSSILLFNKKSILVREPWGVVGIISPWNYPFSIPLYEIFTAIAAGNAVVLKVATQVQRVGEIFLKMVKFAGLPDGLVSVVNLPGKITGEAFLKSGINKLFFTGSVSIGQELVRLSAENLVPLSLELGGNDPMIVCSDANLYRAAAGAVWGGISNAGESCGGVERIYVEAGAYEGFMNELAQIVSGLRQGVGLDADFGSLTTKKQKQTVIAHIRDALDKGAVIRSQSPAVEGDFYHQAVVLENCTHEMEVMKHETFGPVLAVCKVNSINEAVELANDSYLGLSASVWTKNRKKGRTIAMKLEAGAVTLNDHLMSHGMPETPWGGYKMSSLGRSHGGPGLNEVVQSKVIIDDRTHFLSRNIWWHPYSARIYNGLKDASHALYGNGLFSRIKSAFKFISFYLRHIRRDAGRRTR